MQEYTYNSNNSSLDSSGNSKGLWDFLLGLFTGAAIGVPVTALIVKKICNKQKEADILKAAEEAENRGIQAATMVAKEWISNNVGEAERALFEANRGISEGVSSKSEKIDEKNDSAVYVEAINNVFRKVDDSNNEDVQSSEAYLASLQSPPDDSSDDEDFADIDVENYDLTIDDEEATKEAREFSEQHVQYLDMIERYKHTNGGIPPFTISREHFEVEHIYDKAYINWYEEDNVFEENNTVIEDPVYMFGANGPELFSPQKTAVREDPDYCHIRNPRVSTDFEINRIHGSYAKLVRDGEAYYHDDTNSKL